MVSLELALASDARMGRCFLKGLAGDAINAILAAAGLNLRKLLRKAAQLATRPTKINRRDP